MEGPLSPTDFYHRFFFFLHLGTLSNNEETAGARILNTLTLLFAAFKLSFFSSSFSISLVLPSPSRSLSNLQIFFSFYSQSHPSSSSLLISSSVLSPSSHQLSPSGWGRGGHRCPRISRALPTSVPGFFNFPTEEGHAANSLHCETLQSPRKVTLDFFFFSEILWH